jgi:DNA-binding MarR family transcriptional regulator
MIPVPKKLVDVASGLRCFRELDPEFPIQYATSFLIIAQSEGISQTEVAHLIGLSRSGVQRAFARLSKKGSDGKAGYGLIDVRVDVWDMRYRRAYLSAKGQQFAQGFTRAR